MNRAEIIEEISKIVADKKEAERIVRRTFDLMIIALKNGEKVVISSFGTFKTAVRSARNGRNPKTGEPVAVPPKTSVRFKASKQIFN